MNRKAESDQVQPRIAEPRHGAGQHFGADGATIRCGGHFGSSLIICLISKRASESASQVQDTTIMYYRTSLLFFVFANIMILFFKSIYQTNIVLKIL